nr:PREDICTED: isoleucine--tRNA ligase, mitochondrial isoform X1 [Bemisia tabaci]
MMKEFILVSPTRSFRCQFTHRVYRYFSKISTTKSKKYSHTLNLPSTKFQNWVKQEERAQLDQYIYEKYNFADLYKLQRNFPSRPEFILHDGPPYANGDVHMGHAVNKILKDIINRRKLLDGFKIHYVPGWDCHGLPIELKAVESNSQSGLTAVEIRKTARKFAEGTIKKQKKCFKSWGVMADWESGCYSTFNKAYTQNQFHLFYALHEKGLIYRGLKPIYWSPSSRTALAEAELEYNNAHESTSIFFRWRLNSIPEMMRSVIGSRTVFAITWTTTPWTLPSNAAIAFNPAIDYSLITFSDDSSDAYLVASSSIKNLEEKLNKLCSILAQFSGVNLSGLTYQHPLKLDSVQPLLGANFVSTDKGTGLVHIAPAHGPEDFLLGLKNNISISNIVDERGLYTAEAGGNLEGMNIFCEGKKKLMEILRPDILFEEPFIHSYPYDWRTKEPVIFRASHQWFIDTEKIKDDALKSLENVSMAGVSKIKELKTRLEQRPYWCISRQRVWGAPIPVLYNVSMNEPIVSKSLIEHFCFLLDKFGPDFWWTVPLAELIPKNSEDSIMMRENEIKRGEDILDIWFDSGISWSCVLGNDKTADLYLEGVDQLTGWFQSSLLTSVAVREKAPYKSIFVHGYAVDQNMQKMSKSLGNVISPVDIVAGGKDLKSQPAYGIDVLRWWVAAHTVFHSSIPVTSTVLTSSKDDLQKIRLIMKFLLGALNNYSPCDSEGSPFLLDKYMLNCLREFLTQVNSFYLNYQFNLVCQAVTKLITNEVSSLYCHLTKDRLYCDGKDSVSRQACQYTMAAILKTLLFTIGPIVPHLTEEVYSHFTAKKAGSSYFSSDHNLGIEKWCYPETKETIELLLKVKDDVSSKLPPSKRISECDLSVVASSQVYNILQVINKSDMIELLQAANVSVAQDASLKEGFHLEVDSTSNHFCERCRLYASTSADSLCQRCTQVLQSI